MFISPPFQKCPKCGQPDTFGTLMVNDNSFMRRCSSCWHTDSIPLPILNKKVIYIDQFAISDMMKALNTRTKAYKKGSVDIFWRTLFEKLDRLCKLQLIICPDSYIHTNESLMMTGYFEELERMYELLSHGVTFGNQDAIKGGQLYEHALNWASRNPEKPISLNIHDVIYGKINAWQSRFIVSVKMNFQASIEAIREFRNCVCSEMAEMFQRWQSEKGKQFKHLLEYEYKRLLKKLFYNYVSYLQGNTKMTFEDISKLYIKAIHDAFKEAGIPEGEIWNRTMEYLNSKYIREIPFIKISALFFAAIARKTANGGKKNPPEPGMANDIDIISVILPYCDAIFIDKKCHAYLKEKPLCDEVNYGTKIFSVNNKDKFLEYLDSIENSATKEHLFWVRQVYGDKWDKPYTELYAESV